MSKRLLALLLMLLSAVIVTSCSDDSNGDKNSEGGQTLTDDIDTLYPNMKVGVNKFIAKVSTITPAEKASVIEKLAVIRTLFNTDEFEKVVRSNWKEFNKYDEGSLQKKHTSGSTGQEKYTTDYWGGNPDGIPDGGCSVPVNKYWPDLKPCGSMLGFNLATNLRYFLSEVDQTANKYKNLPFYNAPFAKKKFKDLLDEDRMIEIFKKVNYSIIIEKQKISGSDLAALGPYRYLMHLDDPKIIGDNTGLWIAFPNQDWSKAIGKGNSIGIIMHGMMHNLGFSHTQETEYFGRNISPVTAIAQYVGGEGDKLLKGQAPYNKPEIQEMYKKIKEVYMQRYSNL